MLETVTNPVAEAHRYVENAKDILKNHGQLDYETQLYQDRKYVRMAGNTLWNAVLLILDSVFHVKTLDRPHPDIIDYKNAVSNRDSKLLKLVITGYETMHISMGYDGIQAKETSACGIRLANEIIERCAKITENGKRRTENYE